MARTRPPVRAAVRPPRARLNRTRERAETVARGLCDDGVAAEVAADLEGAVRQAEVITSVTRSHVPLIKGAWLQKGAHLDLVGG